MSQSPGLSRRAVLMYGALGAVGLVGALLSQTVPSTGPETSQPSGTATPGRQPKAPDLVKVRDALGPWTVIDPLTSDSSRVVMIRATGTLDEGARTLIRDDTWAKVVNPSMFSYGLIDGRVHVTVGGHPYEVNSDQAFIIETQYQVAYIVTPDGKLFARDTVNFLTK